MGRVLYVDQQGASLHKKGERVLVIKDEVKLTDMPLCNLDQVVLVGTVNVSSQLTKLFLERGVEVHFISTKGKYYGCLQPTLSKNSVLRIAQHSTYQHNSERMIYAREFVRGKLSNMRTLLLRYNRSLNDPALEKASSKMKNIVKKLEKAGNLNELMGLEGAGSHEYFRVFGLLIKDKVPFDFNKRSRRPPEDPVNALLSFCYSLLLKDVVASVQVVGFDPFVGFFHRSDFGRPALALDIMEEFRPVIADSVVLMVLNKGIITEGDFDYMMGGCFLNENGRKKIYRCYEERRKEVITHPIFGYRIPYLRNIELQARFLAKVLTKEITDYKPFLIR
ncbi:CRISPR-associated protein Cas1 [Desulforamulus profundi]|uniref:CRISPR-associated endonuclease Cas1 n=1 Tax=Desulforamulus profundi TaxID=1383067 RepID=A0A2C6MG96_9FIRM|nr:CRISPR-associated protein Cas1 [Desulforamulus profundi]